MTGRFRAKPDGQGAEPPPKIDPTAQIIADLKQLLVDADEITSLGRDHFLGTNGAMVRHAADGVLINVQELCDRLPEGFRAGRPGVPWAAIRGLRNRLGHNYRATDYTVVWTTISTSLPELVKRISD